MNYIFYFHIYNDTVKKNMKFIKNLHKLSIIEEVFSYAGCDICPTLKQCGMCSIINEIYTGDKNIPHPTLCQFQIVVHELTELFFKMFHPTFQEGYVGP